MSKAVVDEIIERAIADDKFRNELFENPEKALAGYNLTEDEYNFLKELSEEDFDDFAGGLGARSTKGMMPGTNGGSRRLKKERTSHQDVNKDNLKFRFDVASPEKIYLSFPFDLAVAILTTTAPLLAEEDLMMVKSSALALVWPENENSIELEIQLTAPACKIHGPDHFQVTLEPNIPLPMLWFLLTPNQIGPISLVINIFQQDAWRGSSRVRKVVVDEPIGTVKMQPESLHMHISEPDLRMKMEQSFSLDDLYKLCSDLQFDPDNVLLGDSKTKKIINLIGYCARRSLIESLITYCKAERPRIVW